MNEGILEFLNKTRESFPESQGVLTPDELCNILNHINTMSRADIVSERVDEAYNLIDRIVKMVNANDYEQVKAILKTEVPNLDGYYGDQVKNTAS